MLFCNLPLIFQPLFNLPMLLSNLFQCGAGKPCTNDRVGSSQSHDRGDGGASHCTNRGSGQWQGWSERQGQGWRLRKGQRQGQRHRHARFLALRPVMWTL